MDWFKQAGMQLQLEHRCGEFKCCQHDFYCAGTAFLQHELLSLEQLRAKILMAIGEKKLSALLQELNGFFTIVCVVDEQGYMIADRLRSRPLFYSLGSQGLQLSDSAVLLAADHSLNDLAAEEYSCTGFVSGSDTLIAGVEQLQAAEYVCWDHKTRQLTKQFYDSFLPQNSAESTSMETWFPQLDKALTDAVQRLISYANGRQLVLPLSGGYDSRAIAIYIKMLGYQNVFCFTFGRQGSPETRISQQIARQLGFQWHCVTYSAAMWRTLRHDTDFIDYLDFIHNFVSVPNIQVYPAVKALLASKHIAPDAVLVPGHTGDFVAGGHMPSPNTNQPVPDYLLQAVSRRHYKFSRQPLSDALQQKLTHQLQAITEQAELAGVRNPVSIAETWNYRERQAKFIVNSNRYYDFFKLDWWMPLWDQPFVALWQQIPYPLRKDKQLWIRFIEQQMQPFMQEGQCAEIGNAEVRTSLWQKYAHRYLDYFLDHNHVSAYAPFSRWFLAKARLSQKPGSLFGYLSDYTLNRSSHVLQNHDAMP